MLQGVDISDIKLIIQWRTTCSMDTLQQRFGRGARSSSVEAYAILFAEAKYFDDERERLELARQERALKRKRTDESTTAVPNKRRRANPTPLNNPPVAIPVPIPLPTIGATELEGAVADFDRREDYHQNLNKAKSAAEVSRKKDVQNIMAMTPPSMTLSTLVRTSANDWDVDGKCQRSIFVWMNWVSATSTLLPSNLSPYASLSHHPHVQSRTTWSATRWCSRVVLVVAQDRRALCCDLCSPDRLRRLYQVARAAFTSDGHTTYLNLTPRSDEIKEISSSRVRAD